MKENDPKLTRRDFIRFCLTGLSAVAAVGVYDAISELENSSKLAFKNEYPVFDISIDVHNFLLTLKNYNLIDNTLSHSVQIVVEADSLKEVDFFGLSDHVLVNQDLKRITIFGGSIDEAVSVARNGRIGGVDPNFVENVLPGSLFSHAILVGCFRLLGVSLYNELEISELCVNYFNDVAQGKISSFVNVRILVG